MLEYFIASDIHGYCTIFKETLEINGFDINNKNHIVIICGDVFDRGNEAKELLDFLLSIPEDRLILIRGNHEDLLDDCLEELRKFGPISHHHWSNGTIDTIAQLTGINAYNIISGLFTYENLKDKLKKYFSLVNRCIDYYETDDYIFVHGWIPVDNSGIYYSYDANWRTSDSWKAARWFNGMDMANNGIIEEGKTIVCGHWHTGYGHFYIHKEGKSQYDNFDIYRDTGIIALDACTAHSHKINMLQITV